MTVCRIKRETDIFSDTAALGTVLFGSANHGTLHCHHSHTALIAGWIAAVSIQASARFRFIETAVRIVRLHGVAVF